MAEQRVEEIIANWKAQPKKIARKLIAQYGEPNEVTSQRLIWHHNGTWKRSELLNEEIPHLCRFMQVRLPRFNYELGELRWQ